MVGNVPNYAQLDIARCFIRLERSSSRKVLTEVLELGEGTVKALLSILKRRKVIASTKEGHVLNSNGKKLLLELNALVTLPREAGYTDFYSDLRNSAAQLKKGFKLSEKTKETVDAVNIRDIAVRNGADAAFILFYRNGKLKMSEKDTYSFTQLQDQFRLKEGDVVLISFAKTKRHAELGVLSQAVLANSAFARLLSERLGVRLERKWYYK